MCPNQVSTKIYNPGRIYIHRSIWVSTINHQSYIPNVVSLYIPGSLGLDICPGGFVNPEYARSVGVVNSIARKANSR